MFRLILVVVCIANVAICLGCTQYKNASSCAAQPHCLYDKRGFCKMNSCALHASYKQCDRARGCKWGQRIAGCTGRSGCIGKSSSSCKRRASSCQYDMGGTAAQCFPKSGFAVTILTIDDDDTLSVRREEVLCAQSRANTQEECDALCGGATCHWSRRGSGAGGCHSRRDARYEPVAPVAPDAPSGGGSGCSRFSGAGACLSDFLSCQWDERANKCVDNACKGAGWNPADCNNKTCVWAVAKPRCYGASGCATLRDADRCLARGCSLFYGLGAGYCYDKSVAQRSPLLYSTIKGEFPSQAEEVKLCAAFRAGKKSTCEQLHVGGCSWTQRYGGKEFCTSTQLASSGNGYSRLRVEGLTAIGEDGNEVALLDDGEGGDGAGSVPLIIGIVAAVVLLVMAAALTLCVVRRRRSSPSAELSFVSDSERRSVGSKVGSLGASKGDFVRRSRRGTRTRAGSRASRMRRDSRVSHLY